MEQCHVKLEGPDDNSSAHVQGFEINDESVNGARANHPPNVAEPLYTVEEVYVKEEHSNCNSTYFQTFDSDDKSGARVSATEGARLCKTEECDIDVKEEPDVSSSVQFDLEDECGTQQHSPSFEDAPLFKKKEFDIDVKDEFRDCNIRLVQEYARSASSQETAGNCYTYCAF